MDDKLLNVIVTIVVIGIWLAQFLIKPKQEQQERHFDDDDATEEEARRRPPNYAEDPYLKVQEEIRRKIAERQAAERAASQTGRTATAPQPHTAQGRHTNPAHGQRSPHQPAQRLPQQPPPRPTASPTVARQSAEALRPKTQPKIAEPARPSAVAVNRQLRPIPQAQLLDRAFPIAQTPAHKTSFPTAARSDQGAYHSSTKLRRTPSERNTSLKAALRTAGSTRQAMLLREILGEPIALRGERRF